MESTEVIRTVTERETLKLDLGSADRPREGYESVDLHHPAAKHRVDLFKFPFPWATSSVDAINCSHFLEHLPAREVTADDCDKGHFVGSSTVWVKSPYIGWDFLFAFMAECHRVLVPGGEMTVVVPNARCNRAFQDPTHRRFFVAETFLYFAREWRVANGLDHYGGTCDFGVNVLPLIPAELALLHPEAQARRFQESWNTVLDWHATLITKK